MRYKHTTRLAVAMHSETAELVSAINEESDWQARARLTDWALQRELFCRLAAAIALDLGEDLTDEDRELLVGAIEGGVIRIHPGIVS